MKELTAIKDTSGASFALRSLRFVLAIHCMALLAQPSIAGEFLSGTDGIVKFHEWTGWLILLLGATQVLFSALAMRLKSVSWGMLIGSAFVLVAEILQAGTGYARFMRVHIPLGVVLFGAVLLQSVSVFRTGRRT